MWLWYRFHVITKDIKTIIKQKKEIEYKHNSLFHWFYSLSSYWIILFVGINQRNNCSSLLFSSFLSFFGYILKTIALVYSCFSMPSHSTLTIRLVEGRIFIIFDISTNRYFPVGRNVFKKSFVLVQLIGI